MQRAWLLSSLLIAVALAGCASDDPDPDADAPEATDDPDAVEAPALTAASSVEAPEWQVGDWFGHHVFFGAEDTSGTHINTVVVEDEGGSWLLATDDPEAAKWEAAWDFPMLGSIGKDDLGTTAFGAEWDLYDFPLTDGKSWDVTFNPLFNGPRELTLTATFDDAIETPYGVEAGFRIEGVNADGVTELETDYIPAIGWYSSLKYFDPSTEAPDDTILHVRAMGKGTDWTGTYLIDEAVPLVQWSGYLTPFDATGSSPPHTQEFTMTDEGRELYGIVIAVASAGVSELVLTDPGGENHRYEAQHTEPDPEGSTTVFQFVELDPVAGTWQFTWAGAGAGVAVGVAQLWEIIQNETPM